MWMHLGPLEKHIRKGCPRGRRNSRAPEKTWVSASETRRRRQVLQNAKTIQKYRKALRQGHGQKNQDRKTESSEESSLEPPAEHITSVGQQCLEAASGTPEDDSAGEREALLQLSAEASPAVVSDEFTAAALGKSAPQEGHLHGSPGVKREGRNQAGAQKQLSTASPHGARGKRTQGFALPRSTGEGPAGEQFTYSSNGEESKKDSALQGSLGSRKRGPQKLSRGERMKQLAEQKRKQREGERRLQEDVARKEQALHEEKKRKRKAGRAAMWKKTKRGQPLMKFRVEKLLDQLTAP